MIRDMVKFIELFVGIGGFRYGLEEANQEDRRCDGEKSSGGCDIQYRRISANPVSAVREQQQRFYTCVWSNELDRYASAIYRYHYGEIYEGDIRTVDPSVIPDHDLITAGFPCQSFSIAGKRGGFEDTRGTLFFEICRIARAKGTKYLLLENVKGLLNHDSGNTFQTIIRTLDELGYDCQWQVLNSKDYGVPQNRERVFIIGNLRGHPRPKVFPIGESSEESNRSEQRDYTGTVKPGWGQKQNDSTYIVQALDANYAKGNAEFAGTKRATVMALHQVGNIDKKGHNSIWGRVYSSDGLATNINSEGGGLGAKTGLYQVNPDKESGRKEPDQQNKMVMINLHEKRTGEWGNGEHQMDESSFTLDSSSGRDLTIATKSNIRRLTPIECERLQGFPDDWTKYGIDKNGKQIEISDSQRYKCCGNAVTTNVITEIGKKLQDVFVKVAGE